MHLQKGYSTRSCSGTSSQHVSDQLLKDLLFHGLSVAGEEANLDSLTRL